MATLPEKHRAFDQVGRWCGLPMGYLVEGRAKVSRGHREHGSDLRALDAAGELEGELVDVGGYGALALLQGRWCWRWWLVVVLSGLAWRVRPRR